MAWNVPNRERAETLARIAEVVRRAEAYDLPVMVEPIVVGEPRSPEAIALEGDGARTALEVGADIIKVAYPGPELMAAWSAELRIPLVILGGPRTGEPEDVLTLAEEAVRARRARDGDRAQRVAAAARRDASSHAAPVRDRPRLAAGELRRVGRLGSRPRGGFRRTVLPYCCWTTLRQDASKKTGAAGLLAASTQPQLTFVQPRPAMSSAEAQTPAARPAARAAPRAPVNVAGR